MAWSQSKPAEKMQILRNLFSVDYAELEITQLAVLSTYMVAEGYKIPSTTNAMLAVLSCLESSGAIETSENDQQKLIVRIKQYGSR